MTFFDSQLHTDRPFGVLIAFFALFFFLLSTAAHAQTALDIPDLSISMIPLNPAPGTTVQLTAQSYSSDLTQASLSWSYGGKTIATGFGVTSVSVTAPKAGAAATVTVTVSGLGQTPATASILLNPASIDMLWEAVDAYTPPFYKGKAELSVGGSFRVTAIPAASAPKQPTYTWTRNGTALQQLSGLGKSSVLLQNTIFNKSEKVSVAAYGGSFQGSGAVTVVTTTPDVVAYQKQDGFTDYAHGSTDTISINRSNAVLRFEPFFFSIPGTIGQALSIVFSVDGQPVGSDPSQNELRISKPDQAGSHTLSFAANTLQYSLQNVQRVFTLLFE